MNGLIQRLDYVRRPRSYWAGWWYGRNASPILKLWNLPASTCTSTYIIVALATAHQSSAWSALPIKCWPLWPDPCVGCPMGFRTGHPPSAYASPSGSLPWSQSPASGPRPWRQHNIAFALYSP